MVAENDSNGRRDRIATGGALVVALALYLATSSSHLTGGDNAELVTIFADGGVPHPPGYPLYCILLRLFAWMPGGAILGSARVTAVIGALSIAALYGACRAWGASSTPSLVATMLYAVSPLAWRLATQAEVFALNALFASLILCVASPRIALAPERRVVVLALLGGLALSNHHTIILLAPTAILAFIRALRASRQRVRAGLLAALSFGAGLLPYLYCYEVGRAPNGRFVWGEPGTLEGLARHVTRADFGTLNLAANDQSPRTASNVALYFTQTASHAFMLLLVVGLFGFVRAIVRSSASSAVDNASATPSRREIAVLVATWALAGPVFAALLNIAPEGLGATLVERFRLLPEVILTIGVAWGLDGWRALRESRGVAALATLAVIAATATFQSWPRVRSEHSDALQRYTENTERAAPPRAVILGTGDYRLFSFLYERATRMRPDVTYIDAHLLGYDWYRARAARELGAPIRQLTESSADAVALVDQAFSLGRPVLVTDVFEPQLVRSFPSYPLGTLIRLLPRDAALPSPETVEAENLAVFATFERGESVTDDEPWAKSVLPTYERPWIALARMFARSGNERAARANGARAEEWRFLRPLTP